MTDKAKESLSALMDEEASEIEVHQLLRGFNSDEALKGSWLMYQQLRAIVRGENCLSSEQHRELHARIAQAVASEGLPETASEFGTGSRSITRRGFVKPAAGVAVAASLMFAAFFVAQTGESPESNSVMADGEPIMPSQAIPARTVSNQQLTNSDNWVDQPAGRDMELTELDDEKKRRLREYLNQHDRMVRMNPNARMVMFDNPANK